MSAGSRTRSWFSIVGICLLAFMGTYFLAMAPFRATSIEEDAVELAAVVSLPAGPSVAGSPAPPSAAAIPAPSDVPPTPAEPEPAGAAVLPVGPEPVGPAPAAPLATAMDLPPRGCRYELPTFSGTDTLPPNFVHDLRRAATALGTRDWIGALDALEPWRETEGIGAGAHFVAGTALIGIGAVEEARQHLEAAAWMAPDQTGVWIELARAHLAAGAPKYAYRAARRALQLSPEDHRAHFARGRALLELNRGDEALAAFERAAEICSTDPDVWNAIGLIWLYRSRPERARAPLEVAVGCTDPPAYAHNNLGIVYEQMGLYEWADREYARCLELDPAHPAAAQSRHRVAPFMAVRPWVGQSRSR